MLLPLRLSLFYAAYFLVIGIQLPFWPLWLESRGLTQGRRMKWAGGILTV
jgi:MFS transporter, PPP family, 3-phenylpropionic acid transporter